MAVNTLRRGPDRDTRALLEYIRRERPANLAYGEPAQTVIAQAHATIDRVIASSGLAHLVVDELHWFMDDVARALVAGQGEELVFELEGLLGKWLAYDLEPNTVQLLLRILLRNLAGIALPTGADTNHEDTKTQSGQASDNAESRNQRPECRETKNEGGETNRQARQGRQVRKPRRSTATGETTTHCPTAAAEANDGRVTLNDTPEAGDAEAGHD